MTPCSRSSSAPSPRPQLAALVFDIAAPIFLYYLLRGAGLSYLLALSAAAVLPALAATYSLLVRRQPDSVALMMLITVLAGISTTIIAHSPRFLLAKDGLFTGVWGAWFIASVRMRRPAALIFARPLMEGMKLFAGRSWDALWETEPQFQRIWRVSSVLWGIGLLADALARIVISYTLPIDAVPGIGGALYPLTFILLQLISNVYYSATGLYPILGAHWLTHRPDCVTPNAPATDLQP